MTRVICVASGSRKSRLIQRFQTGVFLRLPFGQEISWRQPEIFGRTFATAAEVVVARLDVAEVTSSLIGRRLSFDSPSHQMSSQPIGERMKGKKEALTLTRVIKEQFDEETGRKVRRVYERVATPWWERVLQTTVIAVASMIIGAVASRLL